MEFTGNLPLLVALLVFPLIFVISRRNVLALLETREEDNNTAEVDPDVKASDHEHEAEEEVDEGNEEPKNIMQSENNTLQPPKDDPFTLAQLQEFDGSNPEKPIYVSIKGTVFDVTAKKDMYGPGKSYNIFAGKDGSKGLGMSSLKVEDAIPDYTDLPEGEMQTLNDWHSFFSKRYNIVGRVTDLPEAVRKLSEGQREGTL